MKKLIPVISAIALGLVFVPPVMYLAGSMEKSQMQTLMLIGTVAWFVSAPFWMGGKNKESQ